MKIIFYGALALLLEPLAAHAQHEHPEHEIEEVIVTGMQNKSKAETALPVNVLTDESLRKAAAATIGDTLQNQLGVHSTTFGSGVGQPVIRGLSGNRVSVLQSGLKNFDAAGVSQDHASAVEALVAERIEIIRGPATLLYGGGAIGGVVNVIDNRIPEALPESTGGAVEIRANSINDGRAIVGKLEGGGGGIAWHFDGLRRETNDTEIPGYAIDEAALHALHEEEEEEEAIENTRGFIANSDIEATDISGGLSWIGERGFIGIAVNDLENEYGLPPGAHAHEHSEEEEEPEEEVDIRLRVKQQRVDLKSGLELEGFIRRLNADLGFNDYEHRELEGSETGTVFSNRGFNSRITVDHAALGPFSGLWGLQIGDRTFAAKGEEAFIPESDISDWGIFAVETLESEQFIYEFGLRIDWQRIATDGACEENHRGWSASGSAIWQTTPEHNLIFSVSRSERAPSIEELYSNVDNTTCALTATPIEHLASARIERGNPNLNSERSNNLELGWHKHGGDWHVEANAFYNRFDNYIYLQDIGEMDEVIISDYLQADADLFGVEAQATLLVPIATEQHLDLSLLADFVQIELRDGDYLPRTPPGRLGVALTYNANRWAVNLRGTRYADQDKVAGGELSTAGYTRMDASIDYHWNTDNLEALIFLKGNNLTNEEIRDHTSFMKHFAPLPARGFELGLRLSF